MLVEQLGLLGYRPWVEMTRGKGLTETWLAQRLRPYGVRPKSIWIGEVCAKGYMLEELQAVFQRYIPRSEIDALKQEVKAEAGVKPDER